MARRKHTAVNEVGGGGGAPQLDDGDALVEEVAEYLQLQRATPGDGPADDTDRPRHKRVLLAYGGSEPEQEAIAATAWLLSGVDIEVRVLHVRVGDVCRGACFYLETPAEARALTLDAVERLRGSGVAASGVVRSADRSDLVRAILYEADGIAASAILLGGRRRGMVLTVLLGSVSRRIVRGARCPVIVVNSPPATARLSPGSGGSGFSAMGGSPRR